MGILGADDARGVVAEEVAVAAEALEEVSSLAFCDAHGQWERFEHGLVVALAGRTVTGAGYGYLGRDEGGLVGETELVIVGEAPERGITEVSSDEGSEFVQFGLGGHVRLGATLPDELTPGHVRSRE